MKSPPPWQRCARCAHRRRRRDGPPWPAPRRRRAGRSARSGCRRPTCSARCSCGIAAALLAPDRLAVPPTAFTAALAVAGVVLGTLLDSSSLDAIAAGWLPLALVTAATLGISLAAGAVLARADVARRADGRARHGRGRRVRDRRDLGRAGRGRPARRVHAVPARAADRAAHAGARGALFPGAPAQPGRARGAAARRRPRLAADRVRRARPAPPRRRACASRRGALLVPMAIAAVLTLAVPGGEFELPAAPARARRSR